MIMYNSGAALEKARVRVGLVGTGYAAKFRAEALLHDERSQLIAVVGHTAEKQKPLSESTRLKH